MTHMMTSMPCKYNDIHAMTDSAVISVYSLFWENHPPRQGCVVEGVAYVLSLVSSLISFFFLIKIKNNNNNAFPWLDDDVG